MQRTGAPRSRAAGAAARPILDNFTITGENPLYKLIPRLRAARPQMTFTGESSEPS